MQLTMASSSSSPTKTPGLSHCPAGHPLTRVLRTWRERTFGFSNDVLRFECDKCGISLHDDFIAKSCVSCDLDFCETCVSSSHSIRDLMAVPFVPMAPQDERRSDGVSTATTASTARAFSSLLPEHASCSFSGRKRILVNKLQGQRPWEELRGMLEEDPETVREARRDE
jgi:hypothetical protein